MNITILQRGNSHRIRIETRNNGERRFSYETYRSKDAAEARKAELLHAANQAPLNLTDDTVAEYLNQWIDARLALGKIAETTAASYRLALSGFIDAHGSVKLQAVTGKLIQDYYIERLRDAAASTVRHLHTILKTAFSCAVKSGALARDPMGCVEPPKVRKTESVALTEAQLAACLQAVRDSNYGPVVRFALATGFRRGEIAGLRWKNVDLDAKTATVETVRTIAGNQEVEKEPKTDGSARTISLPASIVSELRKLEGQPNERVFDVSLHGMSAMAKRLGAKIGVDGLTFHSFRHTHATHLLRAKAPTKAVSRRLGHSDVKITLQVYAHVLEGDDAGLADTMNGLLLAG
jgi:integrase